MRYERGAGGRGKCLIKSVLWQASTHRSNASIYLLATILGAVAKSDPPKISNTVYLIRYGEKPADDGQDLTAQGQQRAQCLVNVSLINVTSDVHCNTAHNIYLGFWSFIRIQDRVHPCLNTKSQWRRHPQCHDGNASCAVASSFRRYVLVCQTNPPLTKTTDNRAQNPKLLRRSEMRRFSNFRPRGQEQHR